MKKKDNQRIETKYKFGEVSKTKTSFTDERGCKSFDLKILANVGLLQKSNNQKSNLFRTT